MTKNVYILLIALAALTTSCSNTKYLPEGELLYTKGTVEVKSEALTRGERKRLEGDLQGMLRPRPNSKILGLRVKLWFYNIAGEPKKDKGFRHWMRTKLGEEPVLFSQVDLDHNAQVLQNHSQNKGFFKAITYADSTRKGKRAQANYTVESKAQYKIRGVIFPKDSTALDSLIASTASQSVLKQGNGYDLEDIKAERLRIDTRLKENGYYFFAPEHLIVQVDSTVGNKQVDLLIKVKPEAPVRAKQVFKINDVFIYPSFSVRRDTVGIEQDDVTYHNDLVIIDKDDRFKPRIFDRALYFKKGDVYNRTAHNLSLNRLIHLNVFKFVKNQFRVIDDEEGNQLDAFYYLTPHPKKSIRVEVLGKTNSANYTGTELNVNWSNRNTFRGAELLEISAFGGLEVQVSGQNKGFNVYRVGSEAKLTWPRFISPFNHRSSSGFMPRTRATIGYEYQLRQQLYSLNSFTGSFGYLWKENVRKEHQFNVMDVTYVNPGHVTDLYRERIDQDPTLAKVIEKQLIFGPNYTYTYTNTMQTDKKHTFYYKAGLDVAGNLTGLLTGANIRQGDTSKVFGVPFSQFARIEQDFRHYLKLGENSQLASRVFAGVGFSYGNSKEMPYIKQFFNGGTNSIRAFRARSLGPGSFRPDADASDFLPDQSGDIRLEINTEYRAKLFSIVHGAVFVDAGNIWLFHDDEKPGAKFTGDFLKEFAVGTGVGLRFDLSFLILRTDLAFPIRKPFLPENERWVLDQINFGSKNWRRENLVFNLAIGYPF